MSFIVSASRKSQQAKVSKLHPLMDNQIFMFKYAVSSEGPCERSEVMSLEYRHQVSPQEEARGKAVLPEVGAHHSLWRPDWIFIGNHMILFVRFMIHHLKYFLALDSCFKNITAAYVNI